MFKRAKKPPRHSYFNPPPGLTIPITLPPRVPLTAEEIWTARCELRQKIYAEALRDAICPDGARLIPLPCGDRIFFAIVDKEDYEQLSRHAWRAWTGRGYGKVRAITTIEGKTEQMSRLVIGAGHRSIHVRNVNGNTLDNRKTNLLASRGGKVLRTALQGEKRVPLQNTSLAPTVRTAAQFSDTVTAAKELTPSSNAFD